MEYLSVVEAAKAWGVSERTARNYCATGKVPGAFLTGKTWNIPETAERPGRRGKGAGVRSAGGVSADSGPAGTDLIGDGSEADNLTSSSSDLPKSLLEALRAEKARGIRGGIYHKVQVELTYNSNHMEGSRLTHDQTRFIFETNTIVAGGDLVAGGGLGAGEELGAGGFAGAGTGPGVVPNAGVLNVDDIVETANHFRCVDMVIDAACQPLSEALVKRLHLTLKNGTSDSRKGWFAVGEYKRLPNEVGGMETVAPEQVGARLRELIATYERGCEHGGRRTKTLSDLLDFHVAFERIHPFQDGNGRVGRLILFKESLRNDIVPFIIDENLKLFYYRGLHEWRSERGYLTDTCLTAQDAFKRWLDYFRIPYRNDEEDAGPR